MGGDRVWGSDWSVPGVWHVHTAHVWFYHVHFRTVKIDVYDWDRDGRQVHELMCSFSCAHWSSSQTTWYIHQESQSSSGSRKGDGRHTADLLDSSLVHCLPPFSSPSSPTPTALQPKLGTQAIKALGFCSGSVPAAAAYPPMASLQP